MRVDLHCHSTRSDGTLTPGNLACRARDRGVELFALTDHDDTGGFAATYDVLGERAISAVELSCSFEGRLVHLLCYRRPRSEWSAIEELAVQVSGGRAARAEKILERLRGLGADVDRDSLPASSIGRRHIAQALVAAGSVASEAEAFSRYLHDGGPADVTLDVLQLGDAIAVARRTGAAVALAHPHVYGVLAETLFLRFREAGLDGIEAFYGSYPRRQRKKWLALAERFELTAIGGSDFHGDEIKGGCLPGIELPAPHDGRALGWLGLE